LFAKYNTSLCITKDAAFIIQLAEELLLSLSMSTKKTGHKTEFCNKSICLEHMTVSNDQLREKMTHAQAHAK